MAKNLGRFLFFISFFVSSLTYGGIKVKANLERRHVEVGEEVSLSVKFLSEKSLPSPGEAWIPKFVRGLEYRGASRGSSTSMSFSNGASSNQYEKSFDLSYVALKEGKVKIPRMTIKNIGSVGPFYVSIYKKLPAKFRKKLKSKRSMGFGNLFDQLLNNGTSRTQPFQETPAEFFTEVEVDKTSVYKGEQIFARWYIYTSGNLSSFDTLKFPILKGFWKEDVEFASRFIWEPIIKNGKKYNRAVLSSYILIPYKPGTYVIDEFKLRAMVRGSLFGFSSGGKKIEASSEKLRVKVKPLPLPLPDSYYGGVGEFLLETDHSFSDKKEVFLEEPVKISFKLVGNKSSVKFVKPPKLDLGEEFALYSVEEDYKFFQKRQSSIKRFTYTLIPKKEGLIKLPDVKMSFFSGSKYYDVYAGFPLFKIIENVNGNKVQDKNYLLEQGNKKEEKEIHLFTENFLGKVYQIKVHFLIYISVFILILLYGVYLLKIGLNRQDEDESFSDTLRFKHESALFQLKSKKYQKALDELINLNYLLAGGLSGKRNGTEEEFVQALDKLPPSVKKSQKQFIKVNKLAQELRFGTDLSLKENNVKIEGCFQNFKDLFLEVESFLP